MTLQSLLISLIFSTAVQYHVCSQCSFVMFALDSELIKLRKLYFFLRFCSKLPPLITDSTHLLVLIKMYICHSPSLLLYKIRYYLYKVKKKVSGISWRNIAVNRQAG